jgi:hypothetical protein
MGLPFLPSALRDAPTNHAQATSTAAACQGGAIANAIMDDHDDL